MIKSLALLALIATPAFAQLPTEDYAAAAAKAPSQPLVTYDLIGTFPANVPVTKMTAPNASFLIEVTFPQTVPAYTWSTFILGVDAVSGVYCYQGHAYPTTRASFGVMSNDNNYSSLSIATTLGTLKFASGGIPPLPGWFGFPYSVYWAPYGTPGSATFQPQPETQGGYASYAFTFTNVRGQSITGYYADLYDQVGRLVVPAPKPLATR